MNIFVMKENSHSMGVSVNEAKQWVFKSEFPCIYLICELKGVYNGYEGFLGNEMKKMRNGIVDVWNDGIFCVESEFCWNLKRDLQFNFLKQFEFEFLVELFNFEVLRKFKF